MASSYAVLLEPGQHVAPAFLGRRLVIAGTVVGVEAVLGFGEDDDAALGVAGGLQRRRHLVAVFLGDAGVQAAIEAEHPALDLRSDVERRGAATHLRAGD